MTLAHTQSKGREYETFQPTREKRRSASCRLRVVGRGQATPMIVVDFSHAKNNNLGKAWWMGSRVLWPLSPTHLTPTQHDADAGGFVAATSSEDSARLLNPVTQWCNRM